MDEDRKKVLRHGETEPPFSGKLLYNDKDGIYTCGYCSTKLFSSKNKFDSGSGWPSFDEAQPKTVKIVKDTSHGMVRDEVRCAKCDSHLGHLFDDGPQDTTGKRYCINSLALDFKEAKK